MPINIRGKIIRKTDPGFDEAIAGTLFNKRPLDRGPEMMVTPDCVEDIIEAIQYARAADICGNWTRSGRGRTRAEFSTNGTAGCKIRGPRKIAHEVTRRK
ncbi:MAG: hypothetical protein ACKV2V_07950, partial [Blastocatellia bacterium]